MMRGNDRIGDDCSCSNEKIFLYNLHYLEDLLNAARL